jgi:PKD repeat protein
MKRQTMITALASLALVCSSFFSGTQTYANAMTVDSGQSATKSISQAEPSIANSDWYSTTQENIRQSEYIVTWQNQTYLEDLPSAYQAPNRAQNLRAYFTDQGIRVIPRVFEGDTPTWDWGLALTGYGYLADLKPVADAFLLTSGNRIEYQRDNITEWYLNNERGLEQGFTLHTPPQSTTQNPQSEIVLALALSGNLTPDLTDDGNAVEFTTPGGIRVLRYSNLMVYDATGHTLPAHLELINYQEINIVVDTNGAVYPITVDPLASSPSWTAESDQTNAYFGYSVGTAGDVNGDGFSDIIIGARYYDNGQTDEGRAFVYHGSTTGLSAASNWTAESDQVNADFGFSVGTAGDVNGDGYSDVIVGSDLYDNGQTDEGRSYVYHGSATGLGATAAWTAESNQDTAYFGYSVGTAGDVNGDGYSDIIIGSQRYDNGQNDEGRAYVFHGSATGLSTSPAWTAESDQALTYFGNSVATAGDVNNDGYDDVIVGCPDYTNGEDDEGRAYVYHGSASGLMTSPAWTAESNLGYSYFGTSVKIAGDVNGDGYTDVIVGAPWYTNGETSEGRAYVYYGGLSGLNASPAWTAEGNQTYAFFGNSVGTAGDVNGDGFSDIIIGADYYDNGQSNEGRVYVYHGAATGLSATPAWNVESNQANAMFGRSVGTAGDVNGDGYSDVIIGAPAYDKGSSNEGLAFVYNGRDNEPPLSNAGPDQIVDTLSVVTLDGSLSSDPEDDLPLTYLWTQTGGTAVTLSDSTIVNPTFTTPSNPVVLTFTLIVTDSLGLADPTPDEVVITINNQPPVADAGLDQTVNTNTIVTLDGNDSLDPDGHLPLTYSWTQTGGEMVTLSDTTAVNPTFTAPGNPATLTYSLTVTDSLGLPSTLDEVVITVIYPPPPIASFSGDPTSGIAPLQVQFSDDSTGGPTGWAWYFGDEDFSDPWVQMTDTAGWTARYSHTSVVLPDGNIVLMGGRTGSYRNDVWRSSNMGATWTLMTASAGWSARYGHSSVVLQDGSIVLMGGYDSGGRKNDVWRSTDQGATWVQMTANAGWAARYTHTSVSLPDGNIVLMGGNITGGFLGTRVNDVWRSSNQGANWTRLTASAEWAGRNSLTSVVMPDSSIIMMGGVSSTSYRNDVWRSTNQGANWTQITASAEWTPRVSHCSIVLPDGSIILMGGYDVGYLHDVWRSIDQGASWLEITPGSEWSIRDNFSSVALQDGSIVLMGGFSGSGKNDVWRWETAGSYDQNPSHIYTEPGLYPVALQVHNPDGYDSILKTDYIEVQSSPLITSDESTTFLAGTTNTFNVTSTGYPVPTLTYSGTLPDGVAFSDNGDGTATLSGIPESGTGGSFPLTFTASNGIGSDAIQEFSLIVEEAPVADAGPDQNVDTLALVTLDGSGSYDPDDDLPLTYAWAQIGGTTVALSNPTSVNPTFTAPGNPAILTFTLTVTDSVGLPDPTPDEVIITINNQSPLGDAGPDQLVFTLTPVTLDGSDSSDPDDDLPLTYTWTQTGGTTVTLSDPTAVNPIFSAPADPATLTFSLAVTDSLGLPDSTPDEVVITVNNQPPLADAGSDQTVFKITLVTLDGSLSSDPDGHLPLTYLWTQTGGEAVSLSDPTAVNPTFTSPANAGALTFTLMVTDNLGLSAVITDEVVITVFFYTNFLPMIKK